MLNIKSKNFFMASLLPVLGIVIGTVIYGVMTDKTTVVIVERCFFHVTTIFSIMLMLSLNYKIYKNEDIRNVSNDSTMQLTKQQFIDQFVVNFISTWCAQNHEDACMSGQQTRLNKPPIEDARFLAEKAWEHYQFIFGEQV